MYKKRLKKWGLDNKYIRHQDALRMSRVKIEREAAEKATEYTQGRPIGFDRIERHINRRRPHHRNPSSHSVDSIFSLNRISVRTPPPKKQSSPIRPVSPCPSEKLGHVLRHYVKKSLDEEASLAPPTPIDMAHDASTQLARWRHLFCDGTSSLENGDVARGFAIIDEALNRTREILLTNAPNMLKIMIDVTLCDPVACGALFEVIQQHFADLANVVLGCGHPVALFWNSMNLGFTSDFRYMHKLAFVSILDTLESLVGPAESGHSAYRAYHSKWREAVSEESQGRISQLRGLIVLDGKRGVLSARGLVLRLRLCGALLDAGYFHDVVGEMAATAGLLRKFGVEGNSDDSSNHFEDISCSTERLQMLVV